MPSLRGISPGALTCTVTVTPIRSRIACWIVVASGDRVGAGLDRLAADGDLVERLRALDHELVVRRDARLGEQDVLDLGRVEVDAADDQHVVAAAADRAHARERPPARAALAGQRGDVARAVAQERQRLLGQGREDELAVGAVLDALAGVGVDHLDEEVVLLDVQAVARLGALGGDARADDLRQAVDVQGDQAELGLEPLAHPLGPRLGAEHADFQLELVAGRSRPHGDPERCAARRTGVQHSTWPLEVAQERRLARGDAAGDGDRRARRAARRPGGSRARR